MKFPKIRNTLSCAIDKMIQNSYRSIIVRREDDFSVLNIFDVINFKNQHTIIRMRQKEVAKLYKIYYKAGGIKCF